VGRVAVSNIDNAITPATRNTGGSRYDIDGIRGIPNFQQVEVYMSIHFFRSQSRTVNRREKLEYTICVTTVHVSTLLHVGVFLESFAKLVSRVYAMVNEYLFVSKQESKGSCASC
jgi:hypothetical protein